MVLAGSPAWVVSWPMRMPCYRVDFQSTGSSQVCWEPIGSQHLHGSAAVGAVVSGVAVRWGASKHLRAGRVSEPSLPLLRRPAALADQQQPHVWVVERPQDVGCAGDIQARAQRLLRVQAFHDHALVVVEVGLDQAPERLGVGVHRRCGPEDLQHARDALLDHAGVARVAPQLPLGVRLVDDLPIPRPLGDGRLLLVAFQAQVPQRPQQPALGLEGDVDRFQRHPGLGRDLLHRGCRVAALLKQPEGRLEDCLAGRGRLLLAARGVVAPPGLDTLSHFSILHENSLLATSIESGAATRRSVMEPSSVIQRPAQQGSGGGDRGALRRQLHSMWASVAPAWGEHADYADARGAAITARMLKLSAPRPGERVLELACGAGGVGIAAAKLVGPAGEVVLSDVAAEMTAIAAARAAALGLGNVGTLTLDLDDIAQPDQAYDVVLCREGLMFALDPARAVRQIRRVLRPGGRLALAVWGPRARNPWLGLVFDAVGAQLGAPVPPPGVPGPFSLDNPDTLARLLADAELADVVVTEVPTPLRDASFDAWWTRTSSLAGPLAKRLVALPENAKRALRARLTEAVRPYQTPTGLDFPGVSLLAAGRRA